MKKIELLLMCVFIYGISNSQTREPAKIRIDAGNKIAGVTKLFNGANIEDVNNQTNGGMFSQLIFGEAFEENIDVDFLNLDTKDYSKVYVFQDERKIPHLISQANVYNRIPWNNINEPYDVYLKDVYSQSLSRNPDILSGWRFPGRFLPFDSLPGNIREIMIGRLNGNEQISKYWNKLISGNPQFKYTLERNGDAYMGRQTQVITFSSGTGEVGITNHGLYKQGIRFDSGKPYDGILRIKAEKPTTIFLSLRDENGYPLVEKPYQLKGDGSYEKLEYELIPSGNAKKGSFGISLKNKGELRLGFAFLQPGKWGRVPGGWPIRTMFTDALKRQGITAFRYNGSMVDVSPDSYLYRWKKMIGPVDERRICLRTGFNLYGTHSFGFIEMLQAAEAIGAVAILGVSMDETYEDIKDFVEYVNGPVSSKWGALRAKHGHPESYNLKYIQVDNERNISPGYVECMKKFALAAWESDPEMSIMTSLNLGSNGYKRDYSDETRRQYRLTVEMVGWFIAQGKGDKLAWDPHYGGSISFADQGDAYLNEMGITLQKELAKDFPGYWLKLHPMEENGSRCDWNRGLAHAHNWNTNQRHGDSFVMLGTANTFQPHGLHYMWDQGRIHYTSDTIWFQPSAYVDEMIMQTWKPNVVHATCNIDSILDVTAKINDAKNELSIYVVNLSDKPQETVINIDGFKFNTKAEITTIGDCDLNEYNTYTNMSNVTPKSKKAFISKKNAKYTFPSYSFTVITLKK